jgi:LacI family transcriptional regulator
VLGAEMAVEHLARLGHRRIAFVGGPAESSARRDRYAGYRRALDAAGLATDAGLSVTTPVTRTGGYEGILPLLERSDPPTAALCYNDVVAFGVMLRLYSIGVRVGTDFAVVGFDNIEEAALWRPALTTISIPPRHVGEVAARLLLSRIEDPDMPPRQCILDPELVVRDSCGGKS